MIFITGGMAQGKSSFAASLGLPVIDDLEQRIKAWLAQGLDASAALEAELAAFEKAHMAIAPCSCTDSQHGTIAVSATQGTSTTAAAHRSTQKNYTIVCAEIGCGIVPLAKEERIWREVTGRIACNLAAQADEVYKLEAGIAVRLK